MIDIKKPAIIATIAILFAAFIFSLIGAVYERPSYGDFCEERDYLAKPVIEESPAEEIIIVEDIKETNYNECREEYDKATKNFRFFRFWTSSILGLIAVFLSIYLPYNKDSLKEWLLIGFLIGGLAAIFIGTIEYFNDAHRVLKPIILFVEILVVIFVSYKKIKKP